MFDFNNFINRIKEKFNIDRIADKLFSGKINKKDLKGNILLNISLLIRHFVVTHKNLVMLMIIGVFVFIVFIAFYISSHEKKVGEANKWFEISLSFYRRAFIDREMSPEERMQSLKQSIGRFQDVVNRFSGTPLKYDAIIYQGNAYFELGDYNNALAKYQEIIDKKPKHYFADYVLLNIGKCNEQLNNIQGALSAYQQIIEDYKDRPATAEAHFNIAKIKELTNNIQEAFRIYQSIMQTYPQSIWGQEARRRILFIQSLAAQQQAAAKKKTPAAAPAAPAPAVLPIPTAPGDAQK